MLLTSTHTHTHTHTHHYTHTTIHTCTQQHSCTCAHTHTHPHARTHTHTHTHTHTYTHTHTHTHTYTHVHTHTHTHILFGTHNWPKTCDQPVCVLLYCCLATINISNHIHSPFNGFEYWLNFQLAAIPLACDMSVFLVMNNFQLPFLCHVIVSISGHELQQ